ncbi:MAG: nucleotidyltransferase [Alphaproteobacteria bacterium]
MTINTRDLARFLDQVGGELDIPPKKYQDAVDRYTRVGKRIEGGTYSGSSGPPSICPQESFRLGTVVRPIRDGIEAAYDIDLVSELSILKASTTPKTVKHMVGDRLEENGTYARLLTDEGKRCWTLEYAEEDGIGFHLDVLPAVPDPVGLLDTSIAITNNADGVYSWSASNPRGYGAWFDRCNAAAFAHIAPTRKLEIFTATPGVYARVDDVPDPLVRTPLQRAIQIMKRHRDMRFNQRQRLPYAPISIVITTLAASLYNNGADVYSALTAIVGKLQAHASLVHGVPKSQAVAAGDLIQRMPDGRWYIGNPTNPKENFADRWHEDNHARAIAFFAWVEAIAEDLAYLARETNATRLKERLARALGGAPVAACFATLIRPAVAAPAAVPRIQITSTPKPWRS